MFPKQKNEFDTAFKALPFSFDFSCAYKDGQVTAATCKYYCQLFVSPIKTYIFRAPSYMWQSS